MLDLQGLPVPPTLNLPKRLVHRVHRPFEPLLSEIASRPNIRTRREDAKKGKPGYYGFGGAGVEAGFAVVEAGLLAAGLAVVADALAG